MTFIFRGAAPRWVFALGAFLVVASAGAADVDKAKSKYGINKPLGDTFVASSAVDSSQSQLVVYRAPNPKATGIVSLYLDNKYHVALQPNAFSLICAETDRVDLRVRLTPSDADQPPAADTRYSQPLKKGVTHFVRIADQADGRATFEPVPIRVANEDLQNARQQMHTLSRAAVVRSCKPTKDFTTASAELNVITFGAEVHFRSKKADLKAIAPSGKADLDQILEKITQKYADAVQIKVHLIGYADDTSDESVNKRLATARAQAVHAYFLQNGIRAQELSSEGRSAQELNQPLSVTPSKMKVEVEVTVTMN